MYNRGINSPQEQERWLAAGWESVYDWVDLAPEKMQKACEWTAEAINQNQDVQIIVDSDQDGAGASSLICNYFYSRFPEWTAAHLTWLIHTGKQHGITDLLDQVNDTTSLLLVPDAGTNEVEIHKQLAAKGIKCIVLDHHEAGDAAEIEKSPAIVINVQLEDYPNKALTGGGVAYKFVSAFENLIVHGNQPTELMDLCAIANCGDMASYLEPEIRAIINIGFSNVKNPLLHEMIKAHAYTIDKRGGLNYLSAAFGIVPFVNAICRSGTMEEKEMFFQGMLTSRAFDKVESSKRGESGKLVYRYQEAIVVADRVKRRQTGLENDAMDIINSRIQEQHLDDNAIIVVRCEPNEIEANIVGLAANRVQSKYQHPAIVLRRTRQVGDTEDVYRGSIRNYSHCEIANMRSLCESTGIPLYVQGHESAAGIAIAASKVDDFIAATNKLYEGVDFTPTYWVDYIWSPKQLAADTILEIANLTIYGQEMPESMVAVESVPLSESNVTILGLAKGKPTIKVECNGVEMMLFGTTEEEYQRFIEPNMRLTAVCTCSKNTWNGVTRPQLIIQDYELIQKWVF